jgi:hypothetical protein
VARGSYIVSRHGWRKVVESAPATASAGEQTYVGGLRTASKSRPATAGVVDRAPPPMSVGLYNQCLNCRGGWGGG